MQTLAVAPQNMHPHSQPVFVHEVSRMTRPVGMQAPHQRLHDACYELTAASRWRNGIKGEFIDLCEQTRSWRMPGSWGTTTPGKSLIRHRTAFGWPAYSANTFFTCAGHKRMELTLSILHT